MAQAQIVFVWHQHQPYYKDLVTNEYRLPWVRMHALKDYYGMVRLLDEFPEVHQTFNLVPSLILQLEDYLSGSARDPFLEVAAKPARDLSPEERRFIITYFFQANEANLIGRYPRYRELQHMVRSMGSNVERAARFLQPQDITDLQVLSQLAWFDEFFLQDREVAALVRRGRNYSAEDQRFVIAKEREIIASVLPAHAKAAKARLDEASGHVELATSPFYHPILPLVCDTDIALVSHPGVTLPDERYARPGDAREQLLRGLDLHESVFGIRPRGVWPSEGSVSEQVLAIGHELGVEWMATDEGVLGRTLGEHFDRDAAGTLRSPHAQNLYRIWRYERGETDMHMVFRDHSLSDLIGFVYSGMDAREAAHDFIARVRRNAAPVLQSGRDAVIPIILDGENAWEFYHESGREFLRRLYDGIRRAPDMVALTVSEAIASQREAAVRASAPRPADTPPETPPVIGRLTSLVPGSWINANFDVWIGAPEDNRAWDYLSAAREFYSKNSHQVSEHDRRLAMEEILIAEGSDWNWWYGPEHHTANDRDFDELYRKHLSNVYQSLGATPPEYLAQPIAAVVTQASFSPQTAYIHPNIAADYARYFDWIGAAMYTADRHGGTMHGRTFLAEAIYAGIDAENLYARLDFRDGTTPDECDLFVNIEAMNPVTNDGQSGDVRVGLRLEVAIREHAVAEWKLREAADNAPPTQRDKTIAGSDQRRSRGIEMRLRRSFEFKLPLSVLEATLGSHLRLRFSLWRERLPIDALPVEGWIELPVATEERLEANAFMIQE